MFQCMPNPESTNRRQEGEEPLRSGNLAVGDRVAYTKAFLRSIGAFTGDMPHAKGDITNLVPVGREMMLAEVAWDRAELPARVNIKNLCRIGSRAYRD
jgi:hypothetical protein